MRDINCDILVVGAGVAGLCSAIAAARRGVNTILVEREYEIGHKIKGECIRKEAPIFDAIFGHGLPTNVILNNILLFRFHAPNPVNYFDMGFSTTPFVTIDYRLFIGELVKELSKTDCQVLLNTEVYYVLKDGNKVKGQFAEEIMKSYQSYQNI